MARRGRAAFRLAVARQWPEAQGDAGGRTRQTGQAAGYPVHGGQEGVAAGRAGQDAAQVRLICRFDTLAGSEAAREERVSPEIDFVPLLGACLGGLLIYWIASRFAKKAWIQAVIVLAIAVLDLAVRTYYLAPQRYLIFVIYCTVGWAAVLIRHELNPPDTN